MKRTEEHPAEAQGWFTVARAATLLGIAVPRVFDQIRDGKLQVRFEAGEPGQSDRPFVTSAELKQRGVPTAVVAPVQVAPMNGPTIHAAPAIAPSHADDARRDMARLEAELRDARETLDLAEQKIDAALKTIYERDVQIARLEADVAANLKMREGSEGFIRHLEARLDKTEERSEEKEKEIRRLAVGLGEARGEIRLLKPPAPEPTPRLHLRLGAVASALVAVGAAGLCGWIAWQLAVRSFQREAGIVAAVGALAAFAAGLFRDRLRRTK